MLSKETCEVDGVGSIFDVATYSSPQEEADLQQGVDEISSCDTSEIGPFSIFFYVWAVGRFAVIEIFRCCDRQTWGRINEIDLQLLLSASADDVGTSRQSLINLRSTDSIGECHDLKPIEPLFPN